jgi:hypothetical protein
MPHVTPKQVVKDSPRGANRCRFPIDEELFDEAQWRVYGEAGCSRPNENMVMAFMRRRFRASALFDGFEDTLTNFLLEPEAMMDLCNAIG